MADDTRVEFSLEVVVKTSQFENQRPGYRVSTNVRPGEHPNQARERLQALVVEWMKEDVDDIRKSAHA